MTVMYAENGDLAFFSGQRFRRDKRTGYYLSSTAVNGKRKRLHVAVWESVHGKVPDDMAVHHVDHDKNNNEPENLTVLTNSEHTRTHMSDLSEDKLSRMRLNLIDKAVPASKEWHKSDGGREWHSKHAQEGWEHRGYTAYKCSCCGKEFYSRNAYSADANSFCSNYCKTKFRRLSGIDNEHRTCAVCGETFVTNKYSNTRHCSRLCAYRGCRKDRA